MEPGESKRRLAMDLMAIERLKMSQTAIDSSLKQSGICLRFFRNLNRKGRRLNIRGNYAHNSTKYTRKIELSLHRLFGRLEITKTRFRRSLHLDSHCGVSLGLQIKSNALHDECKFVFGRRKKILGRRKKFSDEVKNEPPPTKKIKIIQLSYQSGLAAVKKSRSFSTLLLLPLKNKTFNHPAINFTLILTHAKFK